MPAGSLSFSLKDLFMAARLLDPSHGTRRGHFLSLLVLVISCGPQTGSHAEPPDARAADFVWLEGEQPASKNVKLNLAGWGNKQFLSGEKWLHLSIDADKIDKELPTEGGTDPL